MSLIILYFLLVIAFGLLLLGKRRASLLAVGSAILLLVLVGHGWIPFILLKGLQKESPLNKFDWKGQNAIVLLGIGTVRWPTSGALSSHSLGFSRLHEAARLYFKCKESNNQCQLFITGGDPQRNGASEAEVMQRELIEIGVQDSDIRLEGESNNTFQNAQFTSRILQSEEHDSIVIVTSGVHLSRALMYFSHFKVDAMGSPSDRFEPIISLLPSSYNFAFTDMAIHEYSGFLRYYIYNLLGWNPITSTPGTP